MVGPILEECGIQPPATIEECWTWTEFVDSLRTIRRVKPTLMPLETFMPWGGEWLTYAFTPIIWSNDGQLIADDGSVTHGYMNGPKTVDALRNFQVLFKESLTDKNAPPGQFRAGKAAMAWGIFNRWPDYTADGIPFGMSPLPKLNEARSPSGSRGCRLW